MNATQTALVERCIPLAHKLARDTYHSPAYKFAARGFDVDDLAGEALFGLVKAARDFDPSRGVKFSIVAFKYIKTALNNASYHKSAQYSSNCSYLPDDEETLGDILVGSDPLLGDFEDQCISEVEVEQFVSGLNKKEAYLLSLLLQGRTQEECAKAMAERFGHFSQAAVSQTIKKLRLKFSEFFVDDDDARER